MLFVVCVMIASHGVVLRNFPKYPPRKTAKRRGSDSAERLALRFPFVNRDVWLMQCADFGLTEKTYGKMASSKLCSGPWKYQWLWLVLARCCLFGVTV